MRDLLIRRRNLLIRKQEEELNIRAVCFKADGEQTVTIKQVNVRNKVFQYSYDGVTWESWDLTPLPFGGSTKVYVRGYNKTLSFDSSQYEYFSFSTDAYVYVSGIVESLLDGDNEVLAYGTQGILRQLFYNQTALRSAENLRFEAQSTATDIVSVYALMFDGCTNLLYAPKVLPANDFKGSYNYQYMFRGCKSLITAPELPATTLGSECYQYMFYGCTSLVNAPELPATTLTLKCYQYMFYGCTSLVNAPELPATTLSQYCYQYMFQGCTSLLTAPKIMAMTTAYGSQKGMFKNCTGLINAPELPATNLSTGCYVEMFRGCTSLVNTPELPATTLISYCYQHMFRNCKSIKSIKCRAKVKADGATEGWLDYVESPSGTFYGYSEYGWPSGASGIPTTWTFEELTD